VGGSLWTALLTMSRVVEFYVGRFFFPVNLGANYGFDPSRSLLDPRVWVALAVIAVFVVAAVLTRKSIPGIANGLGWFGIALLPVSNILPVRNVLADRFLYLPALGLCVVVGAFVFAPVSGQGLGGERRRLLPRVALVVLILAAMGLVTIYRTPVWRSDLSLWRDAVLTGPADPTVYTNLGKGYAERGMLRQAERALGRAVQLEPAGWDALFNLGYVHLKLEEPDEAIPLFERALATGKIAADAHEALGQAWLMKGDLREAEQQFKEAIRLDPRLARAYTNYGRLLAKEGRLRDAIAMYEKTLTIDPDYDDAHFYLAEAYRRLGDSTRELNELQAYLRITPTGDRADAVRRRLAELESGP